MDRIICVVIVALAALAGCGSSETNSPATAGGSGSQSPACIVSTLTEALARAAEDKKYIVALIVKDGKRGGLGSVFEEAGSVIPEDAIYTEVDVGISEEQDLIKKYELTDRPKPLILLLTCYGDALSWLPADSKVNDITHRLSSAVVPELVRSIEEKPLVMLLVGPSGTEATKKARDAANSFGESTGWEFKLFTADSADEREAFLVRGAGLSPHSREPALVIYHSGQYKGRLTGELTPAKMKELVRSSGCSC